MADASDWFVVLKEVASDSDKVLVVANILRGTATTEKDAQVFRGVDLAEADVGFNGVALPFASDGPSRLNFVEDHLVAPFFRCCDHRLKSTLDEAVVGIQGVDGFGGVTDNDKDLGHGVSNEG